ncbi:MAG: dihydropteroate synthase [Thermoanaerobaculum sp.]|nr:dihydropteroate synthase [Thermoanaerobaculum sp.]MDW7966910.1 dihydropteroate synthase [Thermoanaerobaculum sp.]
MRCFEPEAIFAQGSPAIMGILNVTPDSFSDGGLFFGTVLAVRRGRELLSAGAGVVDVGGESTRPGAQPVSAEEEGARVLPVVAGLVAQAPQALISVDTSKPEVAEQALQQGAVMINDVTAGCQERMLEVVARAGAGLVLMHMRGTPQTMQQDTRYTQVVAEVAEFLLAQAERAQRAGVPASHIFLDPGIGFGKDLEGNLALLRALPQWAAWGYPLVLGVSRKSFIGHLTGAPVGERLPGSLAALLPALRCPQVVVRVHDVAATRQFLQVARAVGVT